MRHVFGSSIDVSLETLIVIIIYQPSSSTWLLLFIVRACRMFILVSLDVQVYVTENGADVKNKICHFWDETTSLTQIL